MGGRPLRWRGQHIRFGCVGHPARQRSPIWRTASRGPGPVLGNRRHWFDQRAKHPARSPSALALRGLRSESGASAGPHLGSTWASQARPSGGGPVEVQGASNAQLSNRANHRPTIRARETPKDPLDGTPVRAGSRLRRNAQGRAVAPGIPIAPVTPNRVDLAWAAGFFDGEGSTFIRRRDGYVAIGISQSDGAGVPVVLTRFQRVVGGIGLVSGPIPVKTPAGQDAETKWIYNAFGHEMVQAVIAQIWPWLGSVKREQARRSLMIHRQRHIGRSRTAGTTFGRPFQELCKRGHDLRLAKPRLGGSRQCTQCQHERYLMRRAARRP